MKKIIIDTDPGHDDLVAIAMAIHSPEIELLAVTAVNGNSSLQHTAANALRIIEGFGADTPVYAGCAQSMSNEYEYPTQFHGPSGMDSKGVEFAAGRLSLQEKHGSQAIVDLVNRYPGEITLVAIGPLTNIATALQLDPTLPSKVQGLVIMGGGINEGNITPAAEFNIWADPVAARMVFAAGFDLTQFGLNVTNRATLNIENIRQIGQEGNPLIDTLMFYFETGQTFSLSPTMETALHDACTLAYLIQPEIFTVKEFPVTVIDQPGPCFGMTLTDVRTFTGVNGMGHPVKVAVDVNLEAYRQLLTDILQAAVKQLN